MSQFEYMRNVTFGQYLPLDSFLHRSDPRARLVAYLLVLTAVTATPRLEGLLLGLMVIWIGLWIGQISPVYAMRGLLPPLPFILILVIFQLFSYPAAQDAPVLFNIWGLWVTIPQVEAAIRLVLRFCCLVSGLSLAALTLSTTQLIQALRGLLAPLAWTRLPVHDLILMVQVTLHFIPLTAISTERIAKAQAARGAEWGAFNLNIIRQARQVVPVLVPLFLISLRRAETVAIAMQARGYGGSSQPTSMTVHQFRLSDYLIILVASLAAIGIITLNLHLWSV